MVTKIDLKGDDREALKNGVMGLVLAIVEVIRDALRLQAMRRIEGNSLTEEEVERLGIALEEFDDAIEKMKQEHGLNKAVQNVKDDLDEMVNDLVNKVISKEQIEAIREKRKSKGITV